MDMATSQAREKQGGYNAHPDQERPPSHEDTRYEVYASSEPKEVLAGTKQESAISNSSGPGAESLDGLQVELREVETSIKLLSKLRELLQASRTETSSNEAAAAAALALSDSAAQIRLAQFLVGVGSPLLHHLRTQAEAGGDNKTRRVLDSINLEMSNAVDYQDRTQRDVRPPTLLILSASPERAFWAAERSNAHGLTPHVAQNPLAALADALHGTYYHGCLMEVDFPILGGVESLPRLRALSRRGTQRMLIVMVKNGSAEAFSPEFCSRALAAGADYIANDYVEISFANLKAQIERDIELDASLHMVPASTCSFHPADKTPHTATDNPPTHLQPDYAIQHHQHQPAHRMHMSSSNQHCHPLPSPQHLSLHHPTHNPHFPAHTSSFDHPFDPPRYAPSESTASQYSTSTTAAINDLGLLPSASCYPDAHNSGLSALHLHSNTFGLDKASRAPNLPPLYQNGTIGAERRVKRACAHCHMKKLSCSQSRPCQRCLALEQPCVEYVPRDSSKKRAKKGRRMVKLAIADPADDTSETETMMVGRMPEGMPWRSPIQNDPAMEASNGGPPHMRPLSDYPSVALRSAHPSSEQAPRSQSDNWEKASSHSAGALPYSPWQFTAVQSSEGAQEGSPRPALVNGQASDWCTGPGEIAQDDVPQQHQRKKQCLSKHQQQRQELKLPHAEVAQQTPHAYGAAQIGTLSNDREPFRPPISVWPAQNASPTAARAPLPGKSFYPMHPTCSSDNHRAAPPHAQAPNPDRSAQGQSVHIPHEQAKQVNGPLHGPQRPLKQEPNDKSSGSRSDGQGQSFQTSDLIPRPDPSASASHREIRNAEGSIVAQNKHDGDSTLPLHSNGAATVQSTSGGIREESKGNNKAELAPASDHQMVSG